MFFEMLLEFFFKITLLFSRNTRFTGKCQCLSPDKKEYLQLMAIISMFASLSLVSFTIPPTHIFTDYAVRQQG